MAEDWPGMGDLSTPEQSREPALWCEAALLPGGWADGVRIRLDGRRIAGVESGTAAGPADIRAGIALPGLCNVHSHAFQRGMAGLAEWAGPEGDDFWSWREVMYRFLDRLTPDAVQVIAELAYIEMLEAGFTRAGEFHYLHHAPDGRPYADLAEMAARIAAAAQATSIGLTLLPVFYAHADFGGTPPQPGQRRFICDPERFARLVEQSRAAIAGLPDAVLGIAPHSLRAVTPGELAAILPLCPDGPIHIHAAEQTKEVEASLAFSGQRPVEWLLEHGRIGSRWCLIHATHLTAEETAGLARSGAIAGLCPITEANLGDGIFPSADYLAAQGAFGLGTDSNILISAAGELRALEYAQRLQRRQRNVLAGNASTGRTLFGKAIEGGAAALGAEPGRLEAGAPADIVALSPDDPALYGRKGNQILDSWVFAGAMVDAVWRGGCQVVRGGRHIARETIQTRYRATMQQLLG